MGTRNVESEGKKKSRRGERAEYQVGLTMTWPSRKNARTTHRDTLQAVVLADSRSYCNILRYVW